MHQQNGKRYPMNGSYIPALVVKKPETEDAQSLGREEKIARIARHFKEIMLTLGLDLEDDSLKDTPIRVAKMYIKETFSGLDPENKPGISLFENKYSYKQMLVQKDIVLYSTCEHHFVPIIGKVHVGYVSSGKVIGLSKLNRVVNFFARRPQVQERLTMQIAAELKSVLNTEDVAVMIEASHLCIAARGIRDINSNTITAEYSGIFQQPGKRREFISHIS